MGVTGGMGRRWEEEKNVNEKMDVDVGGGGGIRWRKRV